MARKKGAEAKAERATWFAMVLVFALLNFNRGITLPEWFIPVVIATIMAFSGVYQITQKWPVSPFTWGFSALLYVFAFASFFDLYLPVDMILISLGFTVAHIVVGIVSNES